MYSQTIDDMYSTVALHLDRVMYGVAAGVRAISRRILCIRKRVGIASRIHPIYTDTLYAQAAKHRLPKIAW